LASTGGSKKKYNFSCKKNNQEKIIGDKKKSALKSAKMGEKAGEKKEKPSKTVGEGVRAL